MNSGAPIIPKVCASPEAPPGVEEGKQGEGVMKITNRRWRKAFTSTLSRKAGEKIALDIHKRGYTIKMDGYLYRQQVV